ncbi:MAG: tetratricopeptide repeat protein [Acidobacteriota bacterium]|nr:tetratricopeptide repeat protein [Acidobacteriota bacterium]
MARDVSDKLRQKLTGADAQKLAKAPTENAEAYQLYLRGKFYQSKGTSESLRKAIEYYQQALALDANFALAHVGLASSYAPLAHFNNAAARDLRLKAKAAALNALALDDQLLEAHIAFGSILYKDEYDFAGAEREFKRAVEQNPNDSDAHQAYGDLLMCLGRHEESLAELRRALAIDPVSSGANWKYGLSLFFARRYDEAIAQSKKTLELDDTYWWAHRGLAFSYQMKRDYAESVAERVKMSESNSKQQLAASMRESFAKGGWRGFLRDMTAKQRPPDLPLYIVATYHVELGEKDQALAILNQMYEDRATELVTLKVDPRLDPLRGDPRFQALLRRVGLTP